MYIKIGRMKLRSKLFSFYNYMVYKFILPGIKAAQKVTESRKESDGQPSNLIKG